MNDGLTSFLGIHAGETAWIFGKGPSLNAFDIQTAGPIRAAINDVSGIVPDVRYCFAADDVRRWFDVYNSDQVLFQPEKAISAWNPHGRVACRVVCYAEGAGDSLVGVDPPTLAQRLHVRRGTIGSALQIFHVMGITRVVAVGIDGGNAHAPGHKWRTRLRRDHWKDYNGIRADAIRIADELGIHLQFFNPEGHMNDGKIKIRITRGCMADGQSLKEGEVYDLNPSTAYELLALRRAVKVEDEPVAPVKETATVPISARETATIPTKKAAPKKRGMRKP